MKKNILTILIAILISVAGHNVYADGTKGKKEKQARKEKAEKLMVKVSSTLDRELSLESWMTSISEFESAEAFIEAEMMLENWMTESFDIEKELVLEDWMTRVFKAESIDTELALEDWMTEPFTVQPGFQEEELVLEDWMIRF